MRGNDLWNSRHCFEIMVQELKEYAIFGIDTKGRVATWNSGAERIFGWTEEELLGGAADIIFTPEDKEANAPQIEMNEATANGRAADERWHLRKDGSRFWASGVLSAIRLDDELLGYVKVVRDKSEQRIEGVHLEVPGLPSSSP